MKRVLVVEDNAANLRLVGDILTRAGYGVLKAMTAQEGIDAAIRETPDLVLMDVQLPGKDGLTATRELKADPATEAIPVMALTAHAMRGDQDRILAAGCDRYLSKPIRYREFLAIVEEMIGPAE